MPIFATLRLCSYSCFGNQDGKLVAAHDGAFSGSCHDCFVEDSVSGQGPIFQCRCDPIPGRSWVYPGEFALYPVGTLGGLGSEACESEYDADLRPQTSILMSLMARCGVLVRLLMIASIDVVRWDGGVGQLVGKYPFFEGHN